jgi:NAD(P)-dependent dehydrogenase (short-subunit alcohol dehydrogenase family)
MLDRGGVIINNASISGVSVVPNISAYNATKHGVVGLTKSAAVEYARKGIRVNAVAPGAIMTNMLSTGIAGTQEGRDWIGANVPIGRIGEAEDVAEAVVWLASDSARYLTGVLLPVDGGYLISRGGSGKRDRDATAPREEARS